MIRSKPSADELPFGVECEIPLDRVLHDDVLTRPIDAAKVKELIDSLSSKGQQQPIKVRPDGPHYLRVTFGEHRTEAAKQLYASGRTIPGVSPGAIRAIVQDTDEFETLELKITENAHRNEFVDPWEAGRIFDRLVHGKYQGRIDLLARSIGKSTQFISDRTNVYHNLDPSLRQFVGSKLSVANAITLARISPPEQQVKTGLFLVKTRTSGPMGFGGGAGGRMSDGRFVGQTKVSLLHECTCGCGDVHRDRRAGIDIDPNENGVGVRVVLGKSRESEQAWCIEASDNPGYSWCGRELRKRWAVEIPQTVDTRRFRIDKSELCDVCARAWRQGR